MDKPFGFQISASELGQINLIQTRIQKTQMMPTDRLLTKLKARYQAYDDKLMDDYVNVYKCWLILIKRLKLMHQTSRDTALIHKVLIGSKTLYAAGKGDDDGDDGDDEHAHQETSMEARQHITKRYGINFDHIMAAHSDLQNLLVYRMLKYCEIMHIFLYRVYPKGTAIIKGWIQESAGQALMAYETIIKRDAEKMNLNSATCFWGPETNNKGQNQYTMNHFRAYLERLLSTRISTSKTEAPVNMSLGQTVLGEFDQLLFYPESHFFIGRLKQVKYDKEVKPRTGDSDNIILQDGGHVVLDDTEQNISCQKYNTRYRDYGNLGMITPSDCKPADDLYARIQKEHIHHPLRNNVIVKNLFNLCWSALLHTDRVLHYSIIHEDNTVNVNTEELTRRRAAADSSPVTTTGASCKASGCDNCTETQCNCTVAQCKCTATQCMGRRIPSRVHIVVDDWVSLEQCLLTQLERCISQLLEDTYGKVYITLLFYETSTKIAARRFNKNMQHYFNSINLEHTSNGPPDAEGNVPPPNAEDSVSSTTNIYNLINQTKAYNGLLMIIKDLKILSKDFLTKLFSPKYLVSTCAIDNSIGWLQQRREELVSSLEGVTEYYDILRNHLNPHKRVLSAPSFEECIVNWHNLDNSLEIFNHLYRSLLIFTCAPWSGMPQSYYLYESARYKINPCIINAQTLDSQPSQTSFYHYVKFSKVQNKKGQDILVGTKSQAEGDPLVPQTLIREWGRRGDPKPSFENMIRSIAISISKKPYQSAREKISSVLYNQSWLSQTPNCLLADYHTGPRPSPQDVNAKEVAQCRMLIRMDEKSMALTQLYMKYLHRFMITVLVFYTGLIKNNATDIISILSPADDPTSSTKYLRDIVYRDVTCDFGAASVINKYMSTGLTNLELIFDLGFEHGSKLSDRSHRRLIQCEHVIRDLLAAILNNNIACVIVLNDLYYDAGMSNKDSQVLINKIYTPTQLIETHKESKSVEYIINLAFPSIDQVTTSYNLLCNGINKPPIHSMSDHKEITKITLMSGLTKIIFEEIYNNVKKGAEAVLQILTHYHKNSGTHSKRRNSQSGGPESKTTLESSTHVSKAATAAVVVEVVTATTFGEDLTLNGAKDTQLENVGPKQSATSPKAAAAVTVTIKVNTMVKINDYIRQILGLQQIYGTEKRSEKNLLLFDKGWWLKLNNSLKEQLLIHFAQTWWETIKREITNHLSNNPIGEGQYKIESDRKAVSNLFILLQDLVSRTYSNAAKTNGSLLSNNNNNTDGLQKLSTEKKKADNSNRRVNILYQILVNHTVLVTMPPNVPNRKSVFKSSAIRLIATDQLNLVLKHRTNSGNSTFEPTQATTWYSDKPIVPKTNSILNAWVGMGIADDRVENSLLKYNRNVSIPSDFAMVDLVDVLDPHNAGITVLMNAVHPAKYQIDPASQSPDITYHIETAKSTPNILQIAKSERLISLDKPKSKLLFTPFNMQDDDLINNGKDTGILNNKQKHKHYALFHNYEILGNSTDAPFVLSNETSTNPTIVPISVCTLLLTTTR